MKTYRFLSLFLAVVLTVLLLPPQQASALEDFDAQARAALLIEANTGEVLYEKNAHRENYPASVTKVMTALLVFEAVDGGKLSLASPITASETAIALPKDASTAGIKAGETLTVEQLLYCLLLPSANEAANILAEAVDGSVEAFVAHMNRRAQELGCECTHFMNPHGLHNAEHYSSAWDIYLITAEALKHDRFLDICNTKYYEIPENEFSKKRTLYSTNYLISNVRTFYYLYGAAQGIKTGYTPEAGYCLVSSAVRGSRRLISVVLGCERVVEDDVTITKSFTETTRLFDYGFDNFSSKEIIHTDDFVCEVPVTLSSETNYVVAHPAQDVTRMMPNDLAVEDLTRDVTLYSESVEAPIAAGDELGRMVISYGDTVYAELPLLALSDVSASWLLVAQRDVLAFLSQRWVKLTAIGVIALIVLLIVLFGILRSRSRRYGHRRRREYAHSGYRGRRRR